MACAFRVSFEPHIDLDQYILAAIRYLEYECQDFEGCVMPPSVRDRLKAAGLRPTERRMIVGDLLFGSGDRHFSAEEILQEVAQAGAKMSAATIYNTLKLFKNAGLLREIAVSGTRRYYDTKTTSHHHIFDEDQDRLVDIPQGTLQVTGIPEPPAGSRILGVDILVRVRVRPDNPEPEFFE